MRFGKTKLQHIANIHKTFENLWTSSLAAIKVYNNSLRSEDGVGVGLVLLPLNDFEVYGSVHFSLSLQALVQLFFPGS